MDLVVYGDTYNQAMQGLEDMLFELKNPMAQFKKTSYSSMFQEYYQKYEYVASAIEEIYQVEEEPEKWCEKLAGRLADVAEGYLEKISKKSRREDQLLNFNMILVTYLFPTILKRNGRSAEPVTDAMVDTWNKRFKTTIGKASHEKIQEGFQRKFCYITTAVCESLGKEDDCYELRLLRRYRDTYLMATEEGKALVEEYYNIAPTIVTRINRQKDASCVYKDIWNTYLEPCIRYIEQEELEICRRCYMDMVLELKGRYIA